MHQTSWKRLERHFPYVGTRPVEIKPLELLNVLRKIENVVR
jgi:hypothetical protein